MAGCCWRMCERHSRSNSLVGTFIFDIIIIIMVVRVRRDRFLSQIVSPATFQRLTDWLCSAVLSNLISLYVFSVQSKAATDHVDKTRKAQLVIKYAKGTRSTYLYCARNANRSKRLVINWRSSGFAEQVKYTIIVWIYVKVCSHISRLAISLMEFRSPVHHRLTD